MDNTSGNSDNMRQTFGAGNPNEADGIALASKSNTSSNKTKHV